MILAFKYVPAGRPDEESLWVMAGLVYDEKDLGDLPDGEYALYKATKKTVKTEYETDNDLPSSFTYDRRVVVTTKPPAPSVKKV